MRRSPHKFKLNQNVVKDLAKAVDKRMERLLKDRVVGQPWAK